MNLCFRCKYCCNDFYLSKEETELYLNGWYEHEPDTCQDCEQEFNPEFDYELYSDADNGL